ncbi:SsgA family sporulation/cell division regulator [Streptomyces sp. NPDC058644]|uniref:SsgA family sporulation/cell division regulator n=1 Tax=unclassified Streptomyces TaxID=2593676 RepID=UPI003649D23D
MTAQTGGATNHVEISEEDFDALLDASSLGTPRARAIRELTPAAVREQLASRLSHPSAADRNSNRPTPAPRHEPSAAPSVWSRPQHLKAEPGRTGGPRERTGSHQKTQFQIVVPAPISRKGAIFELLQNAFDAAFRNCWRDTHLELVERALYVTNHWAVSFSRAETGLMEQSSFHWSGVHPGIGRFGVGVKLALFGVAPALEQTEPTGSLPLALRTTDDFTYAPDAWQRPWALRPLGTDRREGEGGSHAALPSAQMVEQSSLADNREQRWLETCTHEARRIQDSGQPTQHATQRTDYGFCKAPAPHTRQYNIRWLLTDLDTPESWLDQCVAAFALSCWGNTTRQAMGTEGIAGCADRLPQPSSQPTARLLNTLRTHVEQDNGWQHCLHTPRALTTGRQPACLPAGRWWNLFATDLARAGASHDASACLHTNPHVWPETISEHRWDLCVRHTPNQTLVIAAHAERQAHSRARTDAAPGHPELCGAEAAKTETSAVGLPADSTPQCHTHTEHGVTTVRATMLLSLQTFQQPITIRAAFAYRSNDPFAVHVTFESPSDEPVTWAFARALLAEGLNGASGAGDVQVWTRETQNSGHRTHCMFICLSVPEGTAVLQLRRSDLEKFLNRTRELIDYGQENLHTQPVSDTVEGLLHSNPH